MIRYKNVPVLDYDVVGVLVITSVMTRATAELRRRAGGPGRVNMTLLRLHRPGAIRPVLVV